MSFLIDCIGEPAMFEQLAEECVELAHASLKYARYLRGENPVDASITEETLQSNLIEEAADVSVCLDELGLESSSYQIGSMCMHKKQRMIERLKASGLIKNVV